MQAVSITSCVGFLPGKKLLQMACTMNSHLLSVQTDLDHANVTGAQKRKHSITSLTYTCLLCEVKCMQ